MTKLNGLDSVKKEGFGLKKVQKIIRSLKKI